jgi:uncharacterized alkaline shock family protein YloU
MDPKENDTMANNASDKKNVTIERKGTSGDDPGGAISMSEDVVATIAGLAARQVSGLFSLGKPRLVSFGGDSPTRGVAAEVGDKEAALDLDVVIDYGCDLKATAEQLRKLIGDEVDRMAGRKVVEVNINVVDIHLPEQGDTETREEHRRVR